MVCFYFLTVTDNAMNNHVFLCGHRNSYVDRSFHFSWVYTQQWNCWAIFNSMSKLLMTCQSVIQRRCTIYIPSSNTLRVPVFLHLHQHLLLSASLIKAILMGVKWYVPVVLTCTFLMANDVQVSMSMPLCFLAIYMSFVEKGLLLGPY